MARSPENGEILGVQTRSKTPQKESAMSEEAVAEPATTRAVKKSKVYRARSKTYHDQVSGWRKKNRLLILTGMGSKAEPADFEEACRAQFSQPCFVEFAWMPHLKSTRKHSGTVAVGFDTVAHRVAAEPDLARWVWRDHGIVMEGVDIKKYPKKRKERKTGTLQDTWTDKLPLLPATRTNLRPPDDDHGFQSAIRHTAVSLSVVADAAPSKQLGDHSSSRAINTHDQTRVPRNFTTPKQPTFIDLTGGSSPRSASCAPHCVATNTINIPCAAAAAVNEAASITAETAAAAQAAVDEAQAATFRAFDAEVKGDLEAAAAAKKDAAAAEERARTAYGAAATASRPAAAYSASISLRSIRYQY